MASGDFGALRHHCHQCIILDFVTVFPLNCDKYIMKYGITGRLDHSYEQRRFKSAKLAYSSSVHFKEGKEYQSIEYTETILAKGFSN